MTALSQLLNERMPDGWTGDTIVLEAEKHHEKINRATAFDYLAGRHGKRPSERVLRAFAAALPVTVAELRAAAELPVGENTPWTPPPEANRLDGRQRQAIEELIRAIAAGRHPRTEPQEGSGPSAPTPIRSRPSTPDGGFVIREEDDPGEAIAAETRSDDAPPHGREQREEGRK